MSEAVQLEQSTIERWLECLDLKAPLSSNQPSVNVPFQRWFRFKEAYSPKLVLDVVYSLDKVPQHIFDPFGGCGTSAITAQFLGVPSSVVEVNPFLADLTESKLYKYDLEKLKNYLLVILEYAALNESPALSEDHFPPTFCEPGKSDKWIYRKEVFRRVLQYRAAIEKIEDAAYSRFFKVILGSILVPMSNVFISGKGRKYRPNWQAREKSVYDVDELFAEKAEQAISDVENHYAKSSNYKVFRGSCLEQTKNIENFDLSIFSPPYPNSFDYTDVYNIELWMLGYFSSNNDCKKLRAETLRSHVQVSRSYAVEFEVPSELKQVISELDSIRSELWNKDIPEMILAYFDDLFKLLKEMRKKISDDGDIIIVVGDSSYKSIRVPVTDILGIIGVQAGFSVKENRVMRKLRESPQQGGKEILNESLIWLKPRDL